VRGHVGEKVEGHGRERKSVSAKRCMYRRRYVRVARYMYRYMYTYHALCAYVRASVCVCVYVCVKR